MRLFVVNLSRDACLTSGPKQSPLLVQFSHTRSRWVSHVSTAVSWSTFLRLPLGAGPILGVYVTVLVTTSRMWRTLVLESRFCCWAAEVGVPGTAPAVLGVLDAAAAAPVGSAYRRALRAASQSNGDRTERALQGERGESRFAQLLERAGEGGTARPVKVGPVAGAERGYCGEAKAEGSAAVLIGAGATFGDFA